jgi:hypothetical protein
MQNNNVYTAVSDGNYVRIYNALNGTQVMTRNMGNLILSCVCAGDVLTVTVQISPHSRYMYTYKLPGFTQISSYSI